MPRSDDKPRLLTKLQGCRYFAVAAVAIVTLELLLQAVGAMLEGQ